MTKQIIIVIIAGILIGVGIIIFTQRSSIKKITPQFISSNQEAISTPTPKPTLPPLDENSNLEEETNNLTPKDFSQDFMKIREQLN